MKTRAPLKFVVRFNRRKQSFSVQIWYDKNAFWEFADDKKHEVAALYWPKAGRYLHSGPFGSIHINNDYFTLDTVVHECVHLLVDWMKTRRMRISDRNEERVATLFDEIIRNFWIEYNRAKRG